MPPVRAIYVQLEDGLLVQREVQPDRERHLSGLARELALRAQEEILCELLRDRGAARRAVQPSAEDSL